MPSLKKLRREDYHVAWIAPVSNLELLPARLMLDEKHDTPDYDTNYDDNIYTCGSMVGHNVVIASCPPGLIGNVNAGHVAGFMFKTFANIRMALLVGIGGGVPRAPNSDRRTPDLHLGDVVVGWPGDGKPACVYYDFGKKHTDGRFEMLGTINRPDRVLLNALGALEIDHLMNESSFQEHRERLLAWKGKTKFAFPGLDEDLLFRADYKHDQESMEGCASCDTSKLVERPARTEADAAGFMFHRGRVATGNAVVRTGIERDEISARCGGVMCIEMEAAGVDASRPCLVVRGISDYADSHKNDAWQPYAAGNAAVFCRELLRKIPPSKVLGMQSSSSEASELEAPFLVPFARNAQFAGRESQLRRLKEHVKARGSQSLAVHGLGGCGKTALVVELAYQLKDEDAGCAVFWVPALNAETFEGAYQEIGTALGIPQIHGSQPDGLAAASGSGLRTEASEQAEYRRPMELVRQKDDERRSEREPVIPQHKRNRSDTSPDLSPPSTRRPSKFEEHLTRIEDERISERNDKRNNVPGVHVDIMSLVKTKLSRNDCTPWLMIIDNADDARVLLDRNMTRSGKRLLDYLPRSEKGAFLFTTRSRKAAVDVASTAFEIPQLTEAEGVEFIKKRLSEPDLLGGDAMAAKLLAMLTYLPLAIVQAVAFINKNGVSLQKYIDLFGNATESTLSLLKEHFEDQTRYQMESEKNNNAVAITWRLSFNQIRTDDPLAAEFLGLMACLQRENIPTSVFGSKDSIAKTKALGTLKAYAFITGRVQHARDMGDTAILEEDAYDMHRLVQIATQDWLKDQQEWESQLKEALLVLTDLIPYGDYKAWRVWNAYIPHGIYLASLYQGEGGLAGDKSDLLDRIGRCQHAIGQYRAAEETHQEALSLRKKVYGDEHRKTLISMNEVGLALSFQGKYVEAETMHRKTLALEEKVLGKEHRETLISMNNLGQTLNDQEKYAEAETMHRQTLALEEKVLGKEHPDTLTSMNNLGQTLADQEKYVEAETMDRHTLALREKVLGKEHPDTLKSMNNLGQTLADQEKYVEAETMHRHTLALREKVLGKEHPSTVITISNLGYTLYDQSRYAEAEMSHREALMLRKKAIGETHPQTLVSMYAVGLALASQEKHAEAETTYREVLVLQQKTLGKEHPDTLITMNALGVAMGNQGIYMEAEKIFRETLVLREKVLGMGHPHTLNTIRNLARVLRNQGNHEEARLLLSRILGV